MKITAFFGAGLLAMGTLTAATIPSAASAQRHDGYGYDHRGPDRWHGDRGWHGERGYRANYRNGHRGWRAGYRGGRVVCRVHRGYYGPERVCFRR